MTPKPYAKHQATTTFVRVPAPDWLLVKHGSKTEFRSADMRQALNFAICPTPVVAYAIVGPPLGHDARLMILEKVWREPVGSISEESLLREGYATFADFRRYFKNRTRHPFRPLQEVWCLRLRPWRESDAQEQGQALLQRLYGEWLT